MLCGVHSFNLYHCNKVKSLSSPHPPLLSLQIVIFWKQNVDLTIELDILCIHKGGASDGKNEKKEFII